MKSPLEKTDSWKHASMLWLTANVVGTVLLGLWLLTKGDSNFVAAPIIGFFAAGISLPIILLSVPLFNHILQLPNKQERFYLTFLAVTALFAVTIGLVNIVKQSRISNRSQSKRTSFRACRGISPESSAPPTGASEIPRQARNDVLLYPVTYAWALNLEFNLPASAIVELLFPFYLGAFVATGLEYQQWLFRADE
ncbi:hypothetical protein [Hymenobacter frigidus]|uniref:hypothetical protein n=1 Tax=Hymenobacter frigidus TaxID=1524095 RepID=UPI0016661A92|nr:hypothetical protein [Hymenobacter frigidus]